MNSAVWIWIGIGGGIGSLCRYAAARWAGNRFESVFPWGTLMVNAAGALLLGVLQGSSLDAIWMLLLGTGFLGGMTTFSTWMLESVRLLEEGENMAAAGNLLGSAGAGLTLFWVGYTLVGGHL